MKTYTVQHAGIHHNGTLYPEGSVIELTDNDAGRLGRYVQPCFSAFTPTTSTFTPTTPEPSASGDPTTPPDTTDKTTKKGKS